MTATVDRRAGAEPPAANYLGWTGFANMGDEAIRLAVCAALPDVAFTPAPLRPGDALRRAGEVRALRRRPLVLGGGTVLGRRVWRWHLRQALLLSAPEPAVMLGAGVEDPVFQRPGHGEDRHELRRWSRILDRFDRVTVRGPRSAELLADAGIEATVVGDPALLLDPDPQVTVPADPGLIGINLGVSDDLWGHDQRLVVERTSACVARLAADGWRFRALVVNPADEADAVTCGRLAGIDGPGWEVVTAVDPRAFLAAAAPCRVVVAERLHAAVLASRLGIPTVTLEYQPKCGDFARSVGTDDLALRTDRLRADALSDLVGEAVRTHDARRAALVTRVSHLRGCLDAEAARLAARWPATRP